jgi:hypothetical protein
MHLLLLGGVGALAGSRRGRAGLHRVQRSADDLPGCRPHPAPVPGRKAAAQTIGRGRAASLAARRLGNRRRRSLRLPRVDWTVGRSAGSAARGSRDGAPRDLREWSPFRRPCALIQPPPGTGGPRRERRKYDVKSGWPSSASGGSRADLPPLGAVYRGDQLSGTASGSGPPPRSTCPSGRRAC